MYIDFTAINFNDSIYSSDVKSLGETICSMRIFTL